MGNTVGKPPIFTNAPVIEVAILVQFEPLEIKTADLFKLWCDTALRKRYPEIGEYAELPAFFEEFGKKENAVAPALYHRRTLVLRLNFRDPISCEQFQVQRNRAGFYWQRGPDQTYPGHPYPLNRFWADFDEMAHYLAANKLGEMKPNQCAMSYKNYIPRGQGWNRPEELSKIISIVGGGTIEGDVQAESVAAMQTLTIHGTEGVNARMYLTLNESPDESGAMDFELIVRGAPPTRDKNGIAKFFDTAHDRINEAFKSVTSTEAQKTWGKS